MLKAGRWLLLTVYLAGARSRIRGTSGSMYIFGFEDLNMLEDIEEIRTIIFATEYCLRKKVDGS